ncbi:glycosyltransferase [Streptomyces sp. NPDC001709]
MRTLFVTWAWPSHLYPMVPLAGATRAAGHEVLLCCPPSLVPVAVRTGLPTAAVGSNVDMTPTVRKMVDRASPGGSERYPHRPRDTGRPPTPLDIFARMADAMADGLLDLVRRWQPDVIVYDATTYAAPAVGRACGIPTVRHLWGVDFTYLLRDFETQAFGPLWERLGLGEPVLSGSTPTLDPCPPALQVPVAYSAHRLRHLPYNGAGHRQPRPLPPRQRPRLCVTWGTTSSAIGGDPVLTEVLRGAADLDMDVLFATTGQENVPEDLPRNWHIAVMQPLNQLLRDCDAVISPGGSGTVLTTVAAGLPQMVVPLLPDQEVTAERLEATGAGLRVASREVSRERVAKALTTLLDDKRHTRAARRLRGEMAAQPSPVSTVRLLDRLAGRTPGEREPQ